MVYQICSFFDLKANAEGASLMCFSLTVFHVIGTSTSKPVFPNQVSLRPLLWIYGSCFATALRPKLHCCVWLYVVCIMIAVSILKVPFQTTCISWSQPPHQPTPPYLGNKCSEPLFWMLRNHGLHRKCSTILWRIWGPNLRNSTWNVKHSGSSLSATGNRCIRDAVIPWQCCSKRWPPWISVYCLI